jgi:hypothetical protein
VEYIIISWTLDRLPSIASCSFSNRSPWGNNLPLPYVKVPDRYDLLYHEVSGVIIYDNYM